MKLEELEQYYNADTNTYQIPKEEMIELLGTSLKPTFTENGIKILKCMQENKDKYMNVFTSKNIGELLFISPRSVSGSMKKLISEGYAEKIGVSPVSYGLTDAGMAYKLDNE